MNQFETYLQYINEGELSNVKALLYFDTPKEVVFSDDGIIMIPSGTVNAFGVEITPLIESLDVVYLYDDLVYMDPNDAKELFESAKQKLSSIKKHGNVALFTELKRELKHKVSKKYFLELESSYRWLSESYNSNAGIKALSVASGFEPKELGAIFDMKYILVLTSIARKVGTGKLSIRQY